MFVSDLSELKPLLQNLIIPTTLSTTLSKKRIDSITSKIRDLLNNIYLHDKIKYTIRIKIRIFTKIKNINNNNNEYSLFIKYLNEINKNTQTTKYFTIYQLLYLPILQQQINNTTNSSNTNTTNSEIDIFVNQFNPDTNTKLTYNNKSSKTNTTIFEDIFKLFIKKYKTLFTDLGRLNVLDSTYEPLIEFFIKKPLADFQIRT